jgi:hypothetical protein
VIHRLVRSAALMIVTMVILDGFESIPIARAVDHAQLKDALESAIDDVLHHAIAFTPTIVTLQSARVVGDRIYIVLLIADGDGEETMKEFSVEEPAKQRRCTSSLVRTIGWIART